MRAFTRYLSSRNLKYLNLDTGALAVPYRKTVKKKVAGMSREAMKAILAEPDPKTKVGLRDLTLMITLYGTASRISELLSIRIGDLHLDEQKPYVIITGKGGKIRTLYLLPKAVGFLRLYIKKHHAPTSSKDDYLFYSSIKGRSTALSQQAVFKILRKYASAAHEKCNAVPLELHAHQFRHAKATHWLEDGMNIVQISFLLGHSSVETTMVYYDKKSIMESKLAATLEIASIAASKTLHNYFPSLPNHSIRSWSSFQFLSWFCTGIGSCFESLSLSSAAFFIFKLAFA